MRRSGWLIPVLITAAVCGVANAADATDADVQARLKALEKRVQELEQRLNAAPVAAQPAAPAASPAPATAPVAVAPAKPAVAKWKDASAWGKLERGMGWSQVKALLGPAGATTTGMFGDVWFYPDSSGGRVVFDRDSRVATWIEPPVR